MIIDQTWVRLRLPLPRFAGWFLTFLFFAVSLVLFRSEDFGVSWQMWGAMAGAGGLDLGGAPLGREGFALLSMAALLAFFAPNSQTIALDRLRPMRSAAAAVGIALLAVLVEIGGGGNVEFIYFQF
jgi:hypothetical protein